MDLAVGRHRLLESVEALVSGRRFSVSFQSIPPKGWEKPVRYVGVRASNRRVGAGRHDRQQRWAGPARSSASTRRSIPWPGERTIQSNLGGQRSRSTRSASPPSTARGVPMADRSLSMLDDAGPRHARLSAWTAARSPISASTCPPCGGADPRPRRSRHGRRGHPHASATTSISCSADHIKYGLIVAAAAFAIGSIIAALFSRAAHRAARHRADHGGGRSGHRHAELRPGIPGHRLPSDGTSWERWSASFRTWCAKSRRREEYLESMVRARTARPGTLQRAAGKGEGAYGIGAQDRACPSGCDLAQDDAGKSLIFGARAS